LREKVKKDAGLSGIKVHIPSSALCGDNAAMIAAAGYYNLINGGRQDLSLDVFSRAL